MDDQPDPDSASNGLPPACRSTVKRRIDVLSDEMSRLSRRGEARTPEYDSARLQALGLLRLSGFRRRDNCGLSDCASCGKRGGR
jgi:hypothetical protein